MSLLSTQPYKGTRDFYPEDQRIQNWMFEKMRACVSGFGFQEYNGPMLEPFELYAAKTGEEIVNQQLYWMMDRGERKLAVRPEMTPTLARMVAARVQELPKPIRWFSIPNLWRYERPQRGRLREHWQLNVDVLGGDSLYADAEILNLALDLMSGFGGREFVRIHVNHRRLMDHFFQGVLGLGAQAALSVAKAVDSRAKIGEEKYLKWLSETGLGSAQVDQMERFFASSLEEVSRSFPCKGQEELTRLFELLKQQDPRGELFQFDPKIMRGLDYYTGTVFEMYDRSPENNRAMFGGGRYDNLVGLFASQPLSGVGFGMGDVTLRNFLETHGLMPALESAVDAFVSLPSPDLFQASREIASQLRAQGIRVVSALAPEGFGAQLKQASKLGARYAVLLGDQEWKQGKVVLKNLKTTEQKICAPAEIAPLLKGEKF